jgi:hypothetical protein
VTWAWVAGIFKLLERGAQVLGVAGMRAHACPRPGRHSWQCHDDVGTGLGDFLEKFFGRRGRIHAASFLIQTAQVFGQREDRPEYGAYAHPEKILPEGMTVNQPAPKCSRCEHGRLACHDVPPDQRQPVRSASAATILSG